jgi:hypothetical protein
LIAEVSFVVLVVERPKVLGQHSEEAVVVLSVLEMLMVVRLYFLDLIMVEAVVPVKMVLEAAPMVLEEDESVISGCTDHNHRLVFAWNLLAVEAAQRVPCCE